MCLPTRDLFECKTYHEKCNQLPFTPSKASHIGAALQIITDFTAIALWFIVNRVTLDAGVSGQKLRAAENTGMRQVNPLILTDAFTASRPREYQTQMLVPSCSSRTLGLGSFFRKFSALTVY